jgi:hypothetical protein
LFGLTLVRLAKSALGTSQAFVYLPSATSANTMSVSRSGRALNVASYTEVTNLALVRTVLLSLTGTSPGPPRWLSSHERKHKVNAFIVNQTRRHVQLAAGGEYATCSHEVLNGLAIRPASAFGM